MGQETHRRRRLRLLAVVLLGVAAAGCGSTVPLASQQDLSQGGALGSGTGSTSSDAGPAGVGSGGVASPGVGSAGAGTAAGGAAASSTGPATGAGSSAETATGTRVVQAKAPIVVGIPYVDQQQSNSLTSSVGTGLNSADDKAIYNVLLKRLNARGGILGHKVVPLFHAVDVTQNEADYSAAACADFTQDHHVDIIFVAGDQALDKCAMKAGVAVVGADMSTQNSADYARLGYVQQPDAIALDDLARLQAREFTAMGLFASPAPAKVGVLYYEEPHFVAAEKILESELAKRGVQVVKREAFHYVASSQDVGQTESQIGNAVLSFRSAGVTQVVGVETNAWLIGFFGVHAESQHYYPRYGYTSDEVLTNISANVSAQELKNSVFIGWMPAYDTADTRQYTPEGRACLKLMTDDGQDMSTGNERFSALDDCDNLGFLTAALTAGGDRISRDSLRVGGRAIGTSYRPAGTFLTNFPHGYGAGAAAIRRGKFDDACACFAYTSAPQRTG